MNEHENDGEHILAFMHADSALRSSLAGNGSIMRLAPVAVFAHDSISHAQRLASAQSRTTHQVYV